MEQTVGQRFRETVNQDIVGPISFRWRISFRRNGEEGESSTADQWSGSLRSFVAVLHGIGNSGRTLRAEIRSNGPQSWLRLTSIPWRAAVAVPGDVGAETTRERIGQNRKRLQA